MLKKIMEIISKYAEVPSSSYNEETNIFDLGVDSLRMLQIIMDVEEAFSVRFEDEEIVDIRTASDIEKNILSKFE
jgi:acyl carrier protein